MDRSILMEQKIKGRIGRRFHLTKNSILWQLFAAVYISLICCVLYWNIQMEKICYVVSFLNLLNHKWARMFTQVYSSRLSFILRLASAALIIPLPSKRYRYPMSAATAVRQDQYWFQSAPAASLSLWMASCWTFHWFSSPASTVSRLKLSLTSTNIFGNEKKMLTK